MKVYFAAAAALVLVACTATDVRPVQNVSSLGHVCIVENPKVRVSDFLTVLRDGFDRHGVPTSVVSEADAGECEVTLTYSALRSWDITPYLSQAELRLWRDGAQIASADYHLRGGGGFALNKWAGTRSKMDPVIDELLGG